MRITIHGWHIHNEAAKCSECGMPAHVVAQFEGSYDYFNLCNMCLGQYEISADHIAEVLRKENS